MQVFIPIFPTLGWSNTWGKQVLYWSSSCSCAWIPQKLCKNHNRPGTIHWLPDSLESFLYKSRPRCPKSPGKSALPGHSNHSKILLTLKLYFQWQSNTGTQHTSSVHLQAGQAAWSLPGLLHSRWLHRDRGHCQPWLHNFIYFHFMYLWKPLLYILQLKLLMMKTQRHAKHTETLNGVESIAIAWYRLWGEKFDSIDPVKCNVADAAL